MHATARLVLSNLVYRTDVGNVFKADAACASRRAPPLADLVLRLVERDKSSKLDVLGFVDHSTSATAEFFDDAGMRNGLANH